MPRWLEWYLIAVAILVHGLGFWFAFLYAVAQFIEYVCSVKRYRRDFFRWYFGADRYDGGKSD